MLCPRDINIESVKVEHGNYTKRSQKSRTISYFILGGFVLLSQKMDLQNMKRKKMNAAI